MWTENKIFHEDLDYITSREYINWKRFENKTIFITGGTGLIGFYVINSLLYYNMTHEYKIHVIALIRNHEKAMKMYSSQIAIDPLNLTFVEGNVENLPEIEGQIDFILHAASPTASVYFVENPVETIRTSVKGTWNILQLAKEKNIEGMVYLSSMEVYGSVHSEEKVKEDHASFLDTMSPRNSYPESKRLCENLCASYCKEYNIPVNCIRLTQTFGPGIHYNDQRIFAMLIRCALKGEDIKLLTEGKTKRSYLYLADAATAILTVLSHNEIGKTFNAANEETYCSIHDMANLVANEIAMQKIKVVIKPSTENDRNKFMPELYMNLDTSRLKKMGWSSVYDLKIMFIRTINTMN